ncbi:MAG: hypothetical protein KGQ47_09375 [Hyphomicrobiales bacterium]|nr:hypothetical protein [Hyphomicrobiales bacterium]
MKAGLIGVAAIVVSAMLLAAAPGQAQSPPAASPAPLPAPGVMPPYEVTKMIRSAGFEPLAPPLREGTTYVLRATDFRGILMRVVVDARSGAIRAVNRIVPGPGPYGEVGMAAPPYTMPPAYGPPEDDGSELSPEEAALGPPLSPAPYPVVHSRSASPPLPRPRPAELAAREARTVPKPAAVLPAAQADEVPVAKPQPKPSTAASTPSPSHPPAAAPKRPAPLAIPD